jgi:hypothetical protein
VCRFNYRKPACESLNKRLCDTDIDEVEEHRLDAERIEVVGRALDRVVAATRVEVQPPLHDVELFAEAALRDRDADPDGEVAVVRDAG